MTTTFLLIFLSALLVAGAATPVAERAAFYFGVIDKPNARKVHLKPTPLLGGLAIYLATIGTLLLFDNRQEIAQLVGIIGGATLMSFCGAWDDKRPLSPYIKLLAQTAAALILCVTGAIINLFSWSMLNYALTIGWVIVITNALNLLDNMDGLSSGISAIASLFFMALAVLSGQYLVGSLAAALLGACVGFLRYNFNPARIFMGDSGSLFIGFMLAALGIKLRFPAHSTLITWMVPVVVLAIPLFDSTLVFISRLRRGKNPLTTPGKDHVSHRLVARGATAREAVLMIYVIGCICGAVGIMLSQMTSLSEAYAIGAIMFLVALYMLFTLERNYQTSLHNQSTPQPH